MAAPGQLGERHYWLTNPVLFRLERYQIGQRSGGQSFFSAIKTDGTLWSWGQARLRQAWRRHRIEQVQPCSNWGTDKLGTTFLWKISHWSLR
jgi:alpha-tubulin suppressor-like RCC1 family protein